MPLVEPAQGVADAGGHRLAGPLGLVAQPAGAPGQPGRGRRSSVEQGVPLLLQGGRRGRRRRAGRPGRSRRPARSGGAGSGPWPRRRAPGRRPAAGPRRTSAPPAGSSSSTAGTSACGWLSSSVQVAQALGVGQVDDVAVVAQPPHGALAPELGRRRRVGAGRWPAVAGAGRTRHVRPCRARRPRARRRRAASAAGARSPAPGQRLGQAGAGDHRPRRGPSRSAASRPRSKPATASSQRPWAASSTREPVVDRPADVAAEQRHQPLAAVRLQRRPAPRRTSPGRRWPPRAWARSRSHSGMR